MFGKSDYILCEMNTRVAIKKLNWFILTSNIELSLLICNEKRKMKIITTGIILFILSLYPTLTVWKGVKYEYRNA